MGNTVELIKKYKRPYYVETGSSAGDGIQKAIDAGIVACWGIECDKDRRSRADKRFKDVPTVSIIGGQSERMLSMVLQAVSGCPMVEGSNGMIVFLDAHKVSENPIETYPLLFELNEIKKSKIRDCVIMIDDVRLFNSELKSPMISVLDHIRKINGSYKIDFEDSDTNEKDVLVAHI